MRYTDMNIPLLSTVKEKHATGRCNASCTPWSVAFGKAA